MKAGWPLTGRDAELQRLDSILAQPDRAGVVLAGPPGVGKTRLANEGLELACRHDYSTAQVLASRAVSGIPLGAMAPVIPQLRGAPGGPSEVLHWASGEIARLGGERRLALLVDDVHLLDDTSAALVSQVVVSGSAFVIATLRSGEPSPDAVLHLWKNDLVERIDLRPLDDASLEALLVAALGGAVDGRTARRLTSASAGNVLYLRELVLAGIDSGALVHEGDSWRLVGELPMSVRLVELIEARLGPLSERERDVLEMLAFGEPVGALQLDQGEDAGVIEQLERRGLLRVSQEGRRLDARLAHPLYGEVLRAMVPTLRARAVNRALADAIEGTGGRRREDGLRYATWRVDGGGQVAADVMLEAARQARHLWDLSLAERLAAAAADGGAGLWAGLLLGQLALLQGRPREAEDRFAALDREAVDDRQRAAVASARIHNLLIGLGQPTEAMAVAEAADRAVQDPYATDQVRVSRGLVLFLVGRTRDCLDVLVPALGRLEGANLMNACAVASVALNQAGRFAEALDVSARGAAAVASTGEASSTALPPYVQVLARGIALANAGRLDEATLLADREHQAAAEAGAVEAEASFALLECWTVLLRGRVVTAARTAGKAAALFRSIHWTPYLRFCLAHVAHGRALAGDAAGAAAALVELDGLGIPDSAASGALVVESRAWVAISAGDHSRGRRLLADAADLAADRGDLLLEASALHSLARAGDATVATRLGRVAARVEGDLVQVRLGHARALAGHDADSLARASVAFEQLGTVLYAAEAAAAAAVSLRRAGRSRDATGLERRAANLARRCEGAMTPALVRIETQALLTARELEVAGLAAAGSSNRDIAERLHVSVRTVETQLQRVYEKLGVHRREELPGALEP